MASKTVKVGSSVGLHARPAAVISQEAAKLSSTVTLAAEGGEPIDAKRHVHNSLDMCLNVNDKRLKSKK